MSYVEVTRLSNISKALVNPSTEDKQDALLSAVGLQAKLTDDQPVKLVSSVSNGNSSYVPLGSNAVFTGEWIDCLGVAQITVNARADQLGVLGVQRSSNGVAVGHTTEYAITSTTQGFSISASPRQRYVRIIYTNGAVAQGIFSLTTMTSTAPAGFTFQPLSYPQDDSAMCMNTLANISGAKYDGTHSVVPLDNEGNLRVMAVPYQIAVAEGYIPNHYPINKLGFNDDVDNTAEDVWPLGGSYTAISAGMQLETVSSSANDTAVTGTGARVMHLEYLDTAGEQHEEFISLNGVNVVTTAATDIKHVQSYHIQASGSGGQAAGNIELRHLSNTPVYAYVPAGDSRANNPRWTVPTGYKLFISKWTASSSATASGHFCKFSLLTTSMNGVLTSGVWNTQSRMRLQDSYAERTFEFPIVCPAGTIVSITCVGDASSSNIFAACEWEGWYELDD